MKNGKNILKDGTIKYYKGNKLHREDGPAVIRPAFIYKETRLGKVISIQKIEHPGDWYLNGKLHRVGGPAQTSLSNFGTKSERYFENGIRHREDGPAEVSYIDNEIFKIKYFVNGKAHREDGPAKITFSCLGCKTEEFFKNGEHIETLWTNEKGETKKLCKQKKLSAI